MAAAILVIAFVSTSFPEHPYHWDEVQLAMGIDDFDLARHQPHPPGYVLFIGLAKVIRPLLGGDPVKALRWVSLLALVGFVVWTTKRLPLPSNRILQWSMAASVVAFALASPLLRFFGAAALPYAAEGSLWTILIFAIADRPIGKRRLLLAFSVGLAGGLRQSLPIWAVVLWIFTALRHRGWTKARDLPGLLVSLAAGIVAWMVPLLALSGGWQSYREISGDLVRGNIWSKSIFSAGLEPLVSGRLERMLSDLWMGMGTGLLILSAALVLRWLSPRDATRDGHDVLLIGALLPFVFYGSMIYDSRGYMVSCVMPLGAYALSTVVSWLDRRLSPERQLAPLGLLVALLVAGSWIAPKAEFGVSLFDEYDRHDREVGSRFDAVTRHFTSDDTLLVTSREYWTWGLRQVAYGLPDFATLQLAHDPFFAIVNEREPYLVSTKNRLSAAGPDGIDLDSLLPSSGQGLKNVVYMVPFDVADFIDRSCEPLLHGLVVNEGESLAVIRPGPHDRVRALKQRLVCEVVELPRAGESP